MYNYNNYYNRNIINNINGNTEQLNVYSPYEGFIKGTLFKTLYKPYKNYQPSLENISDEKEKAMLNVQMYYSGFHDLNLYLELYPNDKEALKLREEYFDKYNKAKKDYDSKYSPYSLDSSFNLSQGFTYSKTPFQWEMKK